MITFRLTASDFLLWVETHKITVLDLPTAYWHELVHDLAESGHELPSSLRLVIVGGEKASSSAYSSVAESWWRARALDQHLRPDRGQRDRDGVRAESQKTVSRQSADRPPHRQCSLIRARREVAAGTDGKSRRTPSSVESDWRADI